MASDEGNTQKDSSKFAAPIVSDGRTQPTPTSPLNPEGDASVPKPPSRTQPPPTSPLDPEGDVSTPKTHQQLTTASESELCMWKLTSPSTKPVSNMNK